MTPFSTLLDKIVTVAGNIALLAVLPLTAAVVISSVA
jgi:hypothetical protein